MGWDGYARPKPRGASLRALKEAANAVRMSTGSVDEMLSDGVGLDCSACAEWMQRLTGFSAYEDWTPKQMAERAAQAVTADEPADPEQEWAKQSALAFMRVCAKYKLGMRASY